MPDRVTLREVRPDDLETLFAQQCDPADHWQAATPTDAPGDRAAFLAKWARILADPGTAKQAALCDGRIAGHVLVFTYEGMREVGYWFGHEFRGRGIAARALAAFLETHGERPLQARVVQDHPASRRVLEKCGFRLLREDRSWSEARGSDVDDWIFVLER